MPQQVLDVQLACVLLDLQVLEEVWRRSREDGDVRAWSRGKRHDCYFEKACEAYFVAALIRGRYHLVVAGKKHQIMQHPFRARIAESLRPAQKYRLLRPVYVLGCLLAGAAIRQRSLNTRISVFADNLRKIRGIDFNKYPFFLQSYEMAEGNAITFRDSDIETALAEVYEIAREADIIVEPRWIELVLDMAIGVGIGYLTSFVVRDLEAFLVSFGAAAGSRYIDAPRRVLHPVLLRTQALKDLAHSAAGKLEGEWGSADAQA